VTLLSLQDRARDLQALQDGPLDVLVIGGGIVGAGVARDAAMRGLRTGLVEQHDFAFGTSSRSSRLLHGGLRYLAQGRLGLVREASREKRNLHDIAPHLAEPLAFVFPTYRGTDWPLWQLRIGVKLYDLLCGGRNLGRSGALSRAQVLHRLPGLNPQRLTGAVRYFDALTNDARLVIDTLRSAAQHGVSVLNYCRFRDASRDGAAWRCEVEDRQAGAAHTLRARAIVNATGPWAGGLPHSRVRLRLTKGVHLVVERARLPTPEAVVMTRGERILFIIPWGERVILGTTDTDYAGSLDDVRAEPDDVAYVLRVVNDFFPACGLSGKEVISTWAGLRPLLGNANNTPSDISRSHQIRSPEPDWWDVAGGKLTTYRLMAQQTVDQMARHLDRRVSPCRTAVEPLLPGEAAAAFSGILPPEFSRRAVEHFCANEWALHLDDVMLRRGGWHYYWADADRKAEQAAQWMAELVGWSLEEQAAELGRYRRAAGCQAAGKSPAFAGRNQRHDREVHSVV